ncbi:leucine--tRNA ligase [Mycoplasma iguanae]|uniref:Leucine--tRNA ligase n=1 Tax=Mycoplasma iguanae TaxID=292461 RepID=A0ABY5R8G5_9MOLU|nr:leucine--tRNA ligase [Mycoplasma iguanae]UVD81733.1 leucine--tRNA ligase [Mycoplasma iguanae]
MYNHKQIEQKWQSIWDKTDAFDTTDKYNKKYYSLAMFPYPSGQGIHVGHPQSYTATDIMARFKRLNQFDVLHPMGWDAFGLPAEQYALNTGNHPSVFTQQNINNFRRQLKSLGFSFDYKKEVDTTDPKYYKWTQWIFKKFYEKGLAEIQEIDVNWCPELGTVLANEEVLTDEKGNKVSERGSFPVIKKPMKQWVLKITAYADKLLEGLKEVDFPESLKMLQSKWIGKSEGVELNFLIEKTTKSLKVFTTRVDTIYGVSYIAISPDNTVAKKLITEDQQAAADKFFEQFNNLSDREKLINKEKEGFFTGTYAICPFSKKRIPIWVCNYVLNNFGTGILMGVPAHDERDFEFAKKYDLPIIPIIETNEPLPFTGNGVHINSYLINGLENQAAIAKLIEIGEATGIAKKVVTYKLRDWVFSRQRYWGEPFPVLFDEEDKIYLVNELVELPQMNEIQPSGNGESPLANNKEWINVEIDGKKYRRETNTMPQWAGSSWYYLAYIMKNADGSYVDMDSDEAHRRFKKWLPVDIYIGGQEHAVLHLLYARFWHKVLYDLNIVPTAEPFYKIVNQGMILGNDGQKMSKSRGNVINPDDIVAESGADTLRVYEMFMGPLVDTKAWNTSSIKGIRKWLDRVYNMIDNFKTGKFKIDPSFQNSEFDFIWHSTKKEVTQNIEDIKFNIAISKLMVFVNAIYKNEKVVSLEPLIDFAIMLSLFAPHISEEILEMLGQKQIQYQIWPSYDERKIQVQTVTVAIQVNGKLRGTLEKDVNTSQDETIAAALEVENVKKYIADAKIKKQIYIVNKIINFII